MPEKPKRPEPEKPEVEKNPSHHPEDYDDIPPGVRAFLGDELHLFKRDKKSAILPQVQPRKK